MPVLLVVDDEEAVRYSFSYVFTDATIEVVTAGTIAEGWSRFQEQRPDVIVLDLQLPDGSGLELFRKIQAEDRKRPVVFVTAHGTAETAIEAMKHGAFDYLTKPVDLDKLTQILHRAFEAARLMEGPSLLPDPQADDRLVGRSPQMQEMSKAIGRIAPQEVNVLILGESGTGKELVARALYLHSRRSDGPFLAVNCAAIPDALLESEMFGHEPGAFTGATRRRIGKFEQCDGGTLFLDEIGDMPLSLQAKMLRVIQDQRFERVGGNETIQTRVRILAATNQELEGAVNSGRFRADLYYRLKGATIRVPPLREHTADIPELAHHFLFRFNRELGTEYRGFEPSVLDWLQQLPWPGNVRELQGVIREAMLYGSGHIILSDFLPESYRPKLTALSPVNESPCVPVTLETALDQLIEQLLQDQQGNVYGRAVEALERRIFPRVLKLTGGNQTHASELLGISRGTLRQKMKELGFIIDRVFNETAPVPKE